MINQLQGLKETTDLKATINELYHDDCCHASDLAAEPPIGGQGGRDGADDLLSAMFKRIYALMNMPTTIDKGMVQYFAKLLFAEVEAGYGAKLIGIDWDTPDYLVLRNLQENVYHFAAAKNYQQLKETTRALVGDDGKIRTWTEFKRAAFAINKDHVTTWLKTERELAIASGQMSATWQRAQENKEVLPLLQFDAILDGRTSPICKSLDGVIKPVSDPFWNIYYPPNHFGCRSDVRALPFGTITPSQDIVYPDKIHPMFKTNMAATGVVFPKDHPYFNGLPPQIAEQAQKLLHGK